MLLTDGEDTASLVTRRPGARARRARPRSTSTPSACARTGAADRQRLAFSQAAHLLTALTQRDGRPGLLPAARSRELDAVYDRIAEELRTQYSVGYVSANRRKDGKWRRIVVRVPDRESIQVRHKLGYYAPPTG